MDNENLQQLSARIAKVERRARMAYAFVVVMAGVTMVSLPTPSGLAQENAPKIVRARAVIIEDEQGRERIVSWCSCAEP